MARTAHRRGVRSLSSRNALGRDVGSRARRTPRPVGFHRHGVRELPAERDEQIAAGIVGRLTPRDAPDYLSDAQKRRDSRPAVETLLLAGASKPQRSYGLRKSQLDAYIGLARTPAGLGRLAAWLDSTVDGAACRFANRRVGRSSHI